MRCAGKKLIASGVSGVCWRGRWRPHRSHNETITDIIVIGMIIMGMSSSDTIGSSECSVRSSVHIGFSPFEMEGNSSTYYRRVSDCDGATTPGGERSEGPNVGEQAPVSDSVLVFSLEPPSRREQREVHSAEEKILDLINQRDKAVIEQRRIANEEDIKRQQLMFELQAMSRHQVLAENRRDLNVLLQDEVGMINAEHTRERSNLETAAGKNVSKTFMAIRESMDATAARDQLPPDDPRREEYQQIIDGAEQAADHLRRLNTEAINPEIRAIYDAQHRLRRQARDFRDDILQDQRKNLDDSCWNEFNRQFENNDEYRKFLLNANEKLKRTQKARVRTIMKMVERFEVGPEELDAVISQCQEVVFQEAGPFPDELDVPPERGHESPRYEAPGLQFRSSGEAPSSPGYHTAEERPDRDRAPDSPTGVYPHLSSVMPKSRDRNMFYDWRKYLDQQAPSRLKSGRVGTLLTYDDFAENTRRMQE